VLNGRDRRPLRWEGAFVIDSTRPFYAFGHAFVQALKASLWEGNANDWDVEFVVFHHRTDRREDYFGREVSRYPENHKSI
jgi:hypothetical protein